MEEVLYNAPISSLSVADIAIAICLVVILWLVASAVVRAMFER